MTHLAIATSTDHPQLIETEKNLPELFEKMGIKTSIVIWDDPTVNWNLYSHVLIRSIWDYYKKIDEFYQWLDVLDEQLISCLNPTFILRLNAHKTYLLKLSEIGVPIIPTIFFSSEEFFPNIPEQWTDMVIKPVVSAGAWKTKRFTRNDLPELFQWLREQPNPEWMIQSFIPEIQTEGEYSFFYFGGKFSHAILKTPNVGDFRVQPQYQSHIQLVDFPNQLIQHEVETIFKKLSSEVVYARIDGVIIKGHFTVMEIEMIEPNLFLLTEQSTNNFIHAITSHILS